MSSPFCIGIAGGSASGKSTFCNALQERLSGFRVKVFHMDDYFRPEDQRPYVGAPITGIMYMDDNHPETVDLCRLRSDMLEALNGDSDVVIVEGLLVLWDKEICSRLDLKLFVDCRADERIVRRLRRNIGWGLSFDEVANVYLDMVRYRHDEYVEPSKWKADIILNGSHPSDRALEAIVALIGRSCGGLHRL